MENDILQVRLAPELIKNIDYLVKTGIYSNRSEVLRDAVRRLVLDKLIGIIPNKEDSVTQIRKLRQKLSKNMTKEEFDKINEL